MRGRLLPTGLANSCSILGDRNKAKYRSLGTWKVTRTMLILMMTKAPRRHWPTPLAWPYPRWGPHCLPGLGPRVPAPKRNFGMSQIRRSDFHRSLRTTVSIWSYTRSESVGGTNWGKGVVLSNLRKKYLEGLNERHPSPTRRHHGWKKRDPQQGESTNPVDKGAVTVAEALGRTNGQGLTGGRARSATVWEEPTSTLLADEAQSPKEAKKVEESIPVRPQGNTAGYGWWIGPESQ